MNKSELVADIAAKTKLASGDVSKMIDAFTLSVTEALNGGDKIILSGFGSFEVKEKAERIGCNPKTGEKITIAACKTPCFKAGKNLKEAVR